ncbi:hypothetical protein GE061_015517 [Apolygus lucorum]|nr:hypothetical protein GE061_015517 [Apolygus lucorum]
MSRRRQASAPEPRGQMRGRGRREYSAPPPNRGTRTFRRRPRRQTSNSADSPKSEQLRQNQNNMTKPSRRGPLRRINKPRYTVDFSVKVNGLSSAVRIRDLKAALVERGVRPSDISWRATKGVALLHFAKRRPIQEPAATPGKNVNDVVASLQGLSVKPEDGPRMDLIVEVAQPLAPRAALVGATTA